VSDNNEQTMMPARKTFQQAVRSRDFVLTAQLQLQEDTGRRGVVEQANRLSEMVDAITVPANPQGIVHMAGLAAASLLIANGIDPVLHIASRDRNRIALRSELLGAAAIGVTSLVVQRGDRMARKTRRRAGKGTKIGSLKLLGVAKRLSDFQVQHNEPEIFLGSLATVIDPSRDWQPDVLSKKADTGAQFVQTKMCLDIAMLRRYMARLVAARITHRCQIVVSVPVLPSADVATQLNENLRSEAIPHSFVKRLEAAHSPEQLGIEISAEFLRELRQVPGVGGANLVTLGEFETIPEVINAAEG
jgi:5,10-methylenetetrahydrofolate reductase